MLDPEILEILQLALEEDHLVRLYRDDLTTWYETLYPTAMSDSLIIGHSENDFVFNGLRVLRLRDITWADTRDNDGVYEQILRAEGMLDALIDPKLDISGWQSLFDGLLGRPELVILERESLHEDREEFNIGKVCKVTPRAVYIQYFDAFGKWEETLRRIPYTAITSVTLNSRYTEVFQRHLPPPPAAYFVNED